MFKGEKIKLEAKQTWSSPIYLFIYLLGKTPLKSMELQAALRMSQKNYV